MRVGVQRQTDLRVAERFHVPRAACVDGSPLRSRRLPLTLGGTGRYTDRGGNISRVPGITAQAQEERQD